MDNSNRTIKFRAWDKNDKKIVNNPLATDINQPTNYIGLNSLFNKFKDRGFELMQFTGLKDAKGKEIFEGDILNDGDYNYEVFFLKEYAGFYIKKERETIQLRKDLMENDFEVIGNIYEHGNLLKNN